MKIKQLSFYDHELQWRFEPIEFSDLTLLVGVSGVGKTQILESIVALQSIAEGKSLNGVQWDILFTGKDNLEYHWYGQFETKKLSHIILDEGENEKDKFKIISEILSVNGEILIERDDKKIKFKKQLLPKLSPFESAVAILSAEDDISLVQDSFNKIIYSDQSASVDAPRVIKYTSLAKKYSSSTLDDIKESNLPTQIKLALVYKNFSEIFNQIKNNFIAIFSQVEDIKLEPYEDEELPRVLTEYPFVSIREKDVDDWIPQNKISSGMFRTLMHISEIYLSADDSLVLIDEFENSLGINCIDVVTDLLLENRKLQFIITSHHPYIINNIGMQHWKIVTRKGGLVTAKDAKDFGLGKSRHEAFMQLINLDEYNEGIA